MDRNMATFNGATAASLGIQWNCHYGNRGRSRCPMAALEKTVMVVAGLKHRPIPDDSVLQLLMTLLCNLQMPLPSLSLLK